MLNGIFQRLTYLQKLLTYFFSSLNVSGPFIIDFLHPQLLSISDYSIYEKKQWQHAGLKAQYVEVIDN